MGSEILLSVVIPVFNRDSLVGRAIASALADPGHDVEVVVVDDGSTDRTAEVVTAIADPRVRLVRLPENRGWCPARNAGAEAAWGEWLVFLDSDDEFVPGGLDLIRRRVAAADPSIDKLLFMLRDDYGVTSPDPALDGRIVDYEGYLMWLAESNLGRSELLSCARRRAFLRCPYPDERDWPEDIHELDFAKNARLQFCPDVVRIYHYDAPTRVMLPSRERLYARARGFADKAEAALARHGAALLRVAPRNWTVQVRQAALFRFLSGDRRGGVKFSFILLRRHPKILRAWVVLLVGVLGRRPLAHLYLARLRGRVIE